MKKTVLLVIVLLILLVLTACSKDGTLEIVNDTATSTNIDIDNDYVHLPANRSREFTWELSSSIFGVEERDFNAEVYLNHEHFTSFDVVVKAGSSVREYLSDYIKSPEFRIHNSTRFESKTTLENHSYFVEEGETEVITWWLPYNGSKYVRGTVHSQPFLLGWDFSYLIRGNKIVNKTIEENASMLLIENNSLISRITEVYITPSDSDRWGSSAIDRDVNSGEYVAWNLTPGLWDIKIVNSFSEEYIIYDQYFRIGNLYILEYSGLRRYRENKDTKANKVTCNDSEDYKIKQFPSKKFYRLIDDHRALNCHIIP